MTERRKLIGNEIRAGGRRSARHPIFESIDSLQIHRNHLIRLAARPPTLPLPAQLKPVPDSVWFNQLAYSVLLIAILAVVAVASNLINWAFLIYGLTAVVLRLPSRLIFASALICLVIIPITTALARHSLANVFSVMTFYFLLIGLVRAMLELRRKGSET